MMNNKKYINRIKGIFSLALLSLLFVNFSCNTDDVEETLMFNNLIFSDEFDVEGTPDASKWTFDIGTGMNGWGNGEQQYYTDRDKNVKVENGYLVITAREEFFEGSNYTSARIKTEGIFEQQYGRFEARIRFPYQNALWPAFWLLGNDCDTNIWPQCGEIDMFEYEIGSPKASSMGASLHGPGYSAGNSITRTYELEDGRFDTEFHVFGVEWTEDMISFYADGDIYAQISKEDVEEQGEWVFDHPFYMILNLAVGGFGSSVTADTSLPQTMLVDYVRVYN